MGGAYPSESGSVFGSLLAAVGVWDESAVVDFLGDEPADVGCIRRVTLRNTPRSSGMVASPSRTCSRTLAPDPTGCNALVT